MAGMTATMTMVTEIMITMTATAIMVTIKRTA
jgi:hypothetical protein